MNKIIVLCIAVLTICSMSVSQETSFGKNKVQYKNFSWLYIQSQHFDVYFSEGGYDLATFTADKAEEAYRAIQKSFRYSITNRIPIIVYNSHNDFQQTNVISSYMEEGIGGVTELFKNRVVLPFEGDYKKFRHVIHHELVHAVINDMFYGGSIQSIIARNITLQLPLWFNEGIAEYEALQWDTNSDMFLRDASIHEYLPPIDQLYGYFAYRGGQSVWYYIAQRYGKEKIADILHRVRSTRSVETGFRSALGLGVDEFSERWQQEQKKIYWPDIAKRDEPKNFSVQLTDHRKDGNFYNTSPALSPQGDKIAFLTDRNDYFDVYLISAIDGEIQRKVIAGQRTPDFEELHLLTPGMTWSPDGERLAIATKSGAKDAIIIIDVKTGDEEKIELDLDGIFSVDWSLKENALTFVGNIAQQSDIFVYNLTTKELKNLTNDIFTDADPSWSKDGTTIFFSSDRGNFLEKNTESDFTMQTYDFQQMDLYALTTAEGKIKRLTEFITSDESSPISSPDGKELLFISDKNGINNIYKMNLDSTVAHPITNSIAGIYQLSLSKDGGKLAFVSLSGAGFDIFMMRSPFSAIAKSELEPTEFYKLRHENSFNKDSVSIVSIDSLINRDSVPTFSGDTPFDFHNYVFQPSLPPNPQKRDTILFTETDKKDSNDNYIINPYKLNFTTDIIYGNMGYSTFYGVQGSTLMAFSDMIGDHQIFLQTNLVVDDLKNGDYALAYYYLPQRIDWGFQAFHSARFLDLNRDYLIDTRFRTFGFSLSASFPFTKFKRVEFSETFVRVSREYLSPGVPTQRRDILLPSMSFVHDNVLWGYTGPNNGTRYNLSAYGTPSIGTSGLSFYSALLDYRTYLRLGRGYTFAIRFAGGGSFGKDPQRFVVGGTENWINRRFTSDRIPIDKPEDIIFLTEGVPLRGFDYNAQIGTRYSLLNAELRFPFFGYFAAGPIPIFFQSLTGVGFLDIGSAWNKETSYRGTEKNTTGNVVTKDLLIGTGTGARVFFLGFLLKIDVAWQYTLDGFSTPKYYFSLGADF